MYDSLAADLDLFAWTYQDFLPVVAAGNFGQDEQDSTLTSPAVAKNCVAVGKSSCPLWRYHKQTTKFAHKRGLGCSHGKVATYRTPICIMVCKVLKRRECSQH
jgi:hypothetical protein